MKDTSCPAGCTIAQEGHSGPLRRQGTRRSQLACGRECSLHRPGPCSGSPPGSGDHRHRSRGQIESIAPGRPLESPRGSHPRCRSLSSAHEAACTSRWPLHDRMRCCRLHMLHCSHTITSVSMPNMASMLDLETGSDRSSRAQLCCAACKLCTVIRHCCSSHLGFMSITPIRALVARALDLGYPCNSAIPMDLWIHMHVHMSDACMLQS